MKSDRPELRVMIVDAEPVTRRGLRSLFAEQPGYAVRVAVGSILEARAAWQEQPQGQKRRGHGSRHGDADRFELLQGQR